MRSADDVPPHLREFVVAQDYRQYTEEDQAVWRFAVSQTHAELLRTAHPAYGEGFAAAGISVDRIPRIDEMSEQLSRFGWRAVCVDGFIPPRAFQGFQARGFLPIAADIRSARHLTYTPAPDIIHEAAGHAPFLADPDFARYLRKIGAVAEKAFASRADRDTYAAIFALSEIKEDPASTPAQIAAAEQVLARASVAGAETSEAAKMARLYWWTAEYGLVGTPDNYRLYGAGLLSSLGEGHFCHAPTVRKLPLHRDCVEVGYDITQAQPQLFVARDFGQLEEVLETVAQGLSFRVGGRQAVEAARRSEETATLSLDTGLQVAGVVEEWSEADGAVDWVRLSGSCALARDDRVIDSLARSDGYGLPLGVLEDGTPLSALSSEGLAARTDPAGELTLALRDGLRVRGHAGHRVMKNDRALFILLDGCTIARGDRILFRPAQPFPLALAQRAVTASAGAPEGFLAATSFPAVNVPRPRKFSDQQRGLIALYDRAQAAGQALGGTNVAQAFATILADLDAAYPDEWLPRWTLLERLARLGETGAPVDRLVRGLERLEIRYRHVEPIATGLDTVRAMLDAEARYPRRKIS